MLLFKSTDNEVVSETLIIIHVFIQLCYLFYTEFLTDKAYSNGEIVPLNVLPVALYVLHCIWIQFITCH